MNNHREISRSIPEEIKGDGLCLRKHHPDLAPKMYSCIDSDRDRLRQFLPWVDSTTSAEDSREYIISCQKRWESGDYFDFGIFRSEDDCYMGNIGVHSISWENHRCEIGYWIFGEFEGQGVMSRSIRALEKTLFELGFHRVEITLDPRNERSEAVPKRLGYVFEGVLRESAFESGEHRNMAVYSKLSQEYGSSPAKPKMFEVRMATESDARCILEAHHDSVHKIAISDYGIEVARSWSPEVNEERVNQYLESSFLEETTVVAISDGVICGFGSIVDKDSELRAVYVKDQFGGLGVGSRILSRLESIARARGLKSLSMDSSVTAERFYLKHGYSVVERGEHTLSSGAKMSCFKMRKEL